MRLSRIRSGYRLHPFANGDRATRTVKATWLTVSPTARRLWHPASLFLVVNGAVMLAYLLVPSSAFQSHYHARYSSPFAVAGVLSLAFIPFLVGSLVGSATLGHRRLGASTLVHRSVLRALYIVSATLFVASFVGFAVTAAKTGISLSNLPHLVGDFNQLKYAFRGQYGLATPFRLLYVAGWAVMLALTMVYKQRGSLVVAVIGAVDLAFAFTFGASRLSVLLVFLIIATHLVRHIRSPLALLRIVLAVAILGFAVFSLGVFFRTGGNRLNAGALANKTLIVLGGYFLTPLAYGPSILGSCRPGLVPYEPFLKPVTSPMRTYFHVGLPQNSIEAVCPGLAGFYNVQYSPIGLIGTSYLANGSILGTVVFVFLYGAFAGLLYRLWSQATLLGFLGYPLIVGTIFDSYREPLLVQNVMAVNLFVVVLLGVALGMRIRHRNV